MKKFKLLIVACVALVLGGCGGVSNLHFLCEDQYVELYINDEHIGSGLVNYKVSEDTKILSLKCVRDNEVVYQRNYSVDNYQNNSLIEINIPQNYRYQSRNNTEY